MEWTDHTHHVTKEAADAEARRLRALGWSVEIASEPDPDGWLVTAQFSDDQDDGLWSFSRTKAYRPIRATVAEWWEDEGWGVLVAPEIESDGIWVLFSAIEMEGYKTLVPGRSVEVEVEGPLDFEQDGFRYRAKRVRPLR